MTSISRFVLLVLVFLIVVGSNGCLGCGGEPEVAEVAPASALRQRFPEQAAQVLEQDEAFVATDEGFALEAPNGRGAWQGVGVTLPRNTRRWPSPIASARL